MAHLFMSRARKLFQYVDLQGSTMPSSSETSERRVTMTNGDTTVRIDDTSNGGASMNNESVDQLLRQRRRKKSLLILGGVCTVAIIMIVALTYHDNSAKVKSVLSSVLPSAFSSASHGRTGYSASVDNDRQVKLTDITHSKFHADKFNGTWISDHEILFPDPDGGISIMNAVDGNTFQVISTIQLSQLNVNDWSLSADRGYLLLKRSHHAVFRRSSFGHYSILKLENGRSSNTLVDLRPNNVPHHPEESFNIRLVQWAPVGNAIVYVGYDNNIYYRRTALSQDDKLTDNGIPDEVYNGVPDWVFEEEVIEDNSALWWSPDGNKLVWGHFNDSEVETYILPEYGDWKHIDQYPSYLPVRYPKVGHKNPYVELWLADMSQNGIQRKRILPPASLANEENHFSWVVWANNDQFAVTWMNRVQNKTVATLCSVHDLDCSRPNNEIFNFEQSGGWVEFKYRLFFNPVPPNPINVDFVTILPAPHIKHNFRQLVHIADKSRTYLTQFESAEVTEVHQWTAEGYIYFSATLPERPGTRHLYRILSPSESLSRAQKPEVECLSCGNQTEMSFLHRDPCNYFEAFMSKNGTFYVLECEGPDLPWSCVHHTPTAKFLRPLDTNAEIESVLAEYDLPHVQLIEVPVKDSDQKAQVKLYLPPNFNSQQQYPLVVNVYGGPGFQNVDEKWNQNDFQTYLSANKGVVYAIIDPKGSGFQGNDWMFSVYRNFGGAEVESTLEVTQHLINNLHYVDSSRIALWGWSYGGFLSLSILAHDDTGVFKCAASVAPVVDWRLYDTYYTERYMGLATDNSEGYNRSSVFPYLDKLRGKQYYVLHGTHDDNVHYQQSMLLSAALEEKNIVFRQQAYTDQDHSISRYHTHLYTSLTDFFFRDCFNQ